MKGARNFGDTSQPPEVRIIDFGSAVDNYTLHNMYGHSGPTEREETQEYSPPEAKFGRYGIDTIDRATHCNQAHNNNFICMRVNLSTVASREQ